MVSRESSTIIAAIGRSPGPDLTAATRKAMPEHNRICVPYNQNLTDLEKLLGGVRRPGDFFVQGVIELPMPRIEVDGVGVLSFPVPSAQIQQLIQQATRAPYGRGEQTILDESVRKGWQLPPEKVRIGGKSWKTSFNAILARVTQGLGCTDAEVSAELYKLLVYDTGGFFTAHRDTEKASGMFGTLIVVLPSAHGGGELIIRHAGREVTVDMASAEISELAFAAFYADCEHEVRPVTEGCRVCLVYNLIQLRSRKPSSPLTAPLYSAEVEGASKLLAEAFAEGGGLNKLAWLLEHQYSPAELSFATLKNADAARAGVILAAAQRAGCAVHLGIVHIEESGSAEPVYKPYRGSSRRTYGEDLSGDDFSVIEVCDWERYVDQWVNTENRPAGFGRLPLEDGEVLPDGALDNEMPDEQRLTEATGNEGASFERSYHRAALILWPRARFVSVLLQAGVRAALPHLRDLVAACTGAAGAQAQRGPVIAVAEEIIEVWENSRSNRSRAKGARRVEMVELLAALGERALLARFVSGVVTRQFDGSENEVLAANAPWLGAPQARELFVKVVSENMHSFPCECVNLLTRTIGDPGNGLTEDWKTALHCVAAAIVEALPALKPAAAFDPAPYWEPAEKSKPVDATLVTDLLVSLRKLDTVRLRAEAGTAIAGNTAVFNPGTIVVPALTTLHEQAPEAFAADSECERLWVHAAEFLLARSEVPPEPPADWRQEAAFSCRCEDCRELARFAAHPMQQVCRFRIRQDRRSHVESQIRILRLDISCVTERTGSPQTLVCTKTRRTYRRQCKQHQDDCSAMSALLKMMSPAPDRVARWVARLAAARDRKPEGCN